MAANDSKQEELRVPPNNIEAEQSVLGSLMLDKDAIIKIADFLQPEDFYKDAHGKIFETMLELYESRDPIDVLSNSNKLEEKGELENIGGSSYVASLVNSVPSASHVTHYAKVVQKKGMLRYKEFHESDCFFIGPLRNSPLLPILAYSTIIRLFSHLALKP